MPNTIAVFLFPLFFCMSVCLDLGPNIPVTPHSPTWQKNGLHIYMRINYTVPASLILRNHDMTKHEILANKKVASLQITPWCSATYSIVSLRRTTGCVFFKFHVEFMCGSCRCSRRIYSRAFLFAVYINDPPLYVKHSSSDIFADNCRIYSFDCISVQSLILFWSK